MSSRADTIAAISTAVGPAGIAVVRISGPEAFRVGDAIFTCSPGPLSARRPRTLVPGTVHDGARAIDSALGVIMPGPHSYTGEDTVELHTHGGTAVPRAALRAALRAGARHAEPGEFTRRAFLNGKLDLTQVEAVADLIHARTEAAAELAFRQLRGELSRSVAKIYDTIMQASSAVEGCLEFPDEDLPQPSEAVARGICRAKAEIETLLATYDLGHLVRDGLLVPIVGPVNAGKSTLFNALLERERAIVADVPGTTRDSIEETLSLRTGLVRLVDTAGLRSTGCPIETEGQRRTERLIGEADLLLVVVDGSRPPDADIRERLGSLLKKTRTLLVVNKADLGLDPEWGRIQATRKVEVSLRTDAGPSVVRRSLEGLLAEVAAGAPAAQVAIGERHREHLSRALSELKRASALLAGLGDAGSRNEGRESPEWAQVLMPLSLHLRWAAEELGAITGRAWSSDVLESIFSRFCVGK